MVVPPSGSTRLGTRLPGRGDLDLHVHPQFFLEQALFGAAAQPELERRLLALQDFLGAFDLVERDQALVFRPHPQHDHRDDQFLDADPAVRVGVGVVVEPGRLKE